MSTNSKDEFLENFENNENFQNESTNFSSKYLKDSGEDHFKNSEDELSAILKQDSSSLSNTPQTSSPFDKNAFSEWVRNLTPDFILTAFHYRNMRRAFIENFPRYEWRSFSVRVLGYFFSQDRCLPEYLELLEDVVLENEGEEISRLEMSDFLMLFIYLIYASENENVNIRRRGQKIFLQLLDIFEPVAQQLLLCRIFFMVDYDNISDLKSRVHILAWLVDVYRNKMSDENSGHFFRSELSHFYGQIIAAKDAEMVVAQHFFKAALLLVKAHAMLRMHPDLILVARTNILQPIHKQLIRYQQQQNLRHQAQSIPKRQKLCQKQDIIDESLENFDSTELTIPEFAFELLLFTYTDVANELDNVIKFFDL